MEQNQRSCDERNKNQVSKAKGYDWIDIFCWNYSKSIDTNQLNSNVNFHIRYQNFHRIKRSSSTLIPTIIATFTWIT